jgi:hypothetical protein
MPRFIYLYRGPAATNTERTPEEQQARTDAFGAWMTKVGDALVDSGHPFGASASVCDDGTRGPASDLVGYTIVEAPDLGSATELTEGLPLLAGQTGEFAVEIYELQAP